jgi:hypothetical protein
MSEIILLKEFIHILLLDHCKKALRPFQLKMLQEFIKCNVSTIAHFIYKYNVFVCFSLWETCWFMNDFCSHEWW